MDPRHIAIVLDGNRRFAKKLLLEPWKGHELGAKKLHNLFSWCKEIGIKEITLYCFSMQNFSRPKKEFDFLMNTFEKEFLDIADDKEVHENKVKINAIGRINLLPEKVQKAIADAQETTKNYSDFQVNFCLAYGGREEIIDAVKNIVSKDIKEINEETINNNLYIKSSPDLIIRTGGEKRTSNFLIWQSNYSEWIFLEKTWPEFEKQDLLNAISEFKERERRFGK